MLLDEFGRGTTADYAACIAESTIYALAKEVKARALFATHLHDVHDIIHDEQQLASLESIKFFCTRLSLGAGDDQKDFKYLYELVSGINRDAEAFTVSLQMLGRSDYYHLTIMQTGGEAGRLS